MQRNRIFYSGKFNIDVKRSFRKAGKRDIVKRIFDKDPTVWKKEKEYAEAILNRLGWLHLPLLFKDHCSEINSFADEIREEGFEYAVVLGMGGSSMCPEVCRETFGIKKNYLKLYVLDSTDPGTISDIEKSVTLGKTLFIVSSKSGSTIEVDSFFRYFFEKVKMLKGEDAGKQFIAITDPSTMLEQKALAYGFRKIFINPSDIGGRYSALSYFGLVPAALMGVDIQRLLSDAEKMMYMCSESNAGKNPGMMLGITAGEFAKSGKDKLTFILSPDISSFGYWAEQLIAESTGKEGRGIIPIEGENTDKAKDYGKDRLFINVFTEVNKKKNKVITKRIKTLPLIKINIEDKYSIGGQFYLWEFATAVMGHILKINPFDEPNVKESKDNTSKVLEHFESSGMLPMQKVIAEKKGLKMFFEKEILGKKYSGKKKNEKYGFDELLRLFFKRKKSGDYIALMTYIQNNEANSSQLEKIRKILKLKLKASTTLGYGPRFLHSTGQLHKGGKDNGIFIQIVSDETNDVMIPGKPYSFGVLMQAQSIGDYESLVKHKRRVIKINIGKDTEKGLKEFFTSLKKAV